MKKAMSFIRSVKIMQKMVRYISLNKDKHKSNLDVVEKLSDKVYRVMGLNPGPHTLGGTNTYLIRAKNKESAHVLIDTDHQGGVKAILKELTHRGMLPLPTIHKRIVSNGRYPLDDGAECVHIPDEMLFPLDDDDNGDGNADDSCGTTTLQAVYTPGHTDDHVAFLLFNRSDANPNPKKYSALFTGDCVLGCGTTVFDDLFDYMRSLVSLQALLEQHDVVIYPGHGPVVVDGLAKVKEYIHHRSARENQLLENGNWSSSLALVEKVYGPSLSATLKLSAQANLTHHLNKLLREGKVRTCWPDLWKIHAADN
eukprot:gene32007-41509_t